MGVHGLWQILEPAGDPVDPNSLKGKILAVDASIWLHQVVKGFRDKDGNPVANAHLLGIFFRLCKLLSYGIKPIFVFDGGVPILKRQTLAGRRGRKLEALDKSEASRQKLLSNYIRQQLQKETRRALPRRLTDLEELEEIEALEAGASIISPTKKSNSSSSSPTKRSRTNKFDDVDIELQKFREKFAASTEMDVDRVDRSSFKRDESSSSSEEEEDEWSRRYGMDYAENFSAITSKDFDVLPLETQHEILFEMQESRKMNSWAKMEQMPNNLQDFSNYQMDRLVKRRFLQKKIQSVQTEMGQRHIHVQNLDELLKMDYNFDRDDVVGSPQKGFVLVKKSPHKNNSNKSISVNDSDDGAVVGSLEQEQGEVLNCDSDSADSKSGEKTEKMDISNKSIPDLEEEEQIALAIQLSLMERTASPRKLSQITATEHDNNTSSEPRSSTSNSSFVIPTATASCSKFLDTVGFSSRAITSGLTINHSTSDSDDDDDFEAVPEEGIIMEESNLNEQKMVKILLKNADFQESSSSTTPSSAVTSINIADVLSKVPKEDEDDIFADIFVENTNENGHSPNSTPLESQQKNLKSPSDNSRAAVDDEEATNWDSDPDVELIESLENSFTSDDKKEPPTIITNLVQTASSSSADIIASNQQINRTLGRLPTVNNNKVTMITAEYMQAQAKLNSEQNKLQAEKGFQERVATSISDQISVETQELLTLFGIPYIISKMEAEAQCAFFDLACLTDGTITDDSDAWLFGSLRVYKNFYSAGNKPITFYQLANITKQLGLDRDKLVLIAMLSGGDYSDGISGVGPVTALEILAEFPTTNEVVAFDALLKFKEWWELVNADPNVKVPDLSKAREKFRKLKLKPGFPNEAVYEAYMNPSIDSSTEPFRWGTLDIEAIRSYVEKKFGWDQTKCDSMLLPVLKCQIDKSKQPTLDRFLVSSTSSRYDLDKQQNSTKRKKRGESKRLQTAFKKLKQCSIVKVAATELNLTSESSSEEDDDAVQLKTPAAVVNSDDRKEKEEESESTSSTTIIHNQNKVMPRRNNHNSDANIIPQKVQHETNQAIAKKKAIDVFIKLKNTK